MTERWSIYEIELNGPTDGNLFLEVQLSARFQLDDRTFEPQGFYDGEGVYRIRFMPDEIGQWHYITRSNIPDLDGKTGQFECVGPSADNHGPVKIDDTFYFRYADGTPYHQFGTTCYAWAHQGEEMEEQTLNTLSSSPFNKIRLCIFPKDYVYNKNEPVYYPYEGTPLDSWDFSRFNPAFWQHFEQRILDLQKLGVEADIILFHTYDRWGFEYMDAESDDHYIRYAVARLAAYRNIWWSLANEYDFMPAKQESDWDRFFQIIQSNDPYSRLRSIHNGRRWYDHNKSWVTHASLQTSDMAGGIRYRQQYQKPIVYDECKYEGNIPHGWGNITAKQMVQRFWAGSVSGCYVGHGETYEHPEDLLWWSKGGVLHGQSPSRIAYLKAFVESMPAFETLQPIGDDQGQYVLAKPGEYYLAYSTEPQTIRLDLPGDQPYKIDGIDTWNMEIVPIGTAQPGEYVFSIYLPDFAYRLTPYEPGEKIRPEAKASADVMEGHAPLAIVFAADNTSTKDLKIEWDFGDGETSTETNPSHTYQTYGQYTTTLTVTDGDGLSSVTAFAVNVLPPAPTNFDANSQFPGSSEGLLFQWASANSENSVPDASETRLCQVDPRGDVNTGTTGEMVIKEGAFVANVEAETLMTACQSTDQLTIECVVIVNHLDQDGPARIITCSEDIGNRNFTLGQEGERFAWRLRTPITGANGIGSEVSFGQIQSNQPMHVIVSYFPGSLCCYIDGDLVHTSKSIQGDFSNWNPYQLLFGQEFNGQRNWQGQLSHIAIYNRFVGTEEARHKYQLVKGSE